MEATQVISDSFLESDEAENEEEDGNKRGQPLAKLCILKNEHFPETEFPLFLGNNVLGRDLNTCTLHLPAPSISKQHATISLSVYSRRGRRSEEDVEPLVWDLGSMNGTRKGRLKLTPNVRYALSDGDSLVVADIPCQYVSCTVDANSSQGGMRAPVGRDMGVKAQSPDASGKKAGEKSPDGKKCDNKDTNARESATETPIRASCLFLEQTPTQPEGTLVPESDTDSDGEREGGGRGHKALESDSESHKSSPACSTFLSPTNKIVPESEDESPITPSSSAKNRPYRHVTFSKEETEVDVAGQRLEEKKTPAIVDDSEEEGGREKETVTPEGTKSQESGQHVPVTQERDVSSVGNDELPVSTSTVTTDVVLVFNMDSDTDVEGEEEGAASAGPVTLNINRVSQPANTADLNTDSDPDVDEDALDKDLKTGISSDDSTKLSPVNSAVQPEGMTMDSDTDVDDDAAESDAATKTKPVSVQNAPTADSGPSMQPKDFHLDSDTDVDDEDEGECGTNESSSKIDDISIKLEIKAAGPEWAAPAPHGLHFDSDTDDEEIPAPTLSEPPVVLAVAADSCTASDRGAAVVSNSDTDVEDDSPQVMSVAVTASSASPGTMPAALQSDSDADTDVEGSGQSASKPTDLGLGSDADVEDREAGINQAGDEQIPNLCRENTPGLLAPLLQNCSTPVPLSEGEMASMDTQVFVSPLSVPFFRAGAVAAAVRPGASCSDSQEDEDFVVAETQSFILQTTDLQSNPPEDHATDPTQAFCLETSDDETDFPSSRERSFQMGLSDSSDLQCQAQALAMENTQAFVERGVNMQDTQAYAATSTADGPSADTEPNLDATQAYEEDEEPARCPEKEPQPDLVLEATQAYISTPDSDSESEMDEDEIKNITATAETQAFGLSTSCTSAMAETQPISAFEEEESAAEESGEHGGTLQPQQRLCGEVLSIVQTQPMNACSSGGNDDDEEEEQTQPLAGSDSEGTLTNSEVCAVEIQPVDAGEGGESNDEDSIPALRRRRAKPLQLEESQSLSGSEIFVAATQPMGACEGEQSDEDDSIPGPRKRKTKHLRLEEEEMQSLTVGTESMETGQNKESHDEDSIPVFRTRVTKSEAGTSGTSVRNKRATRAGIREEGNQAECSESSKRQTRGKSKALPKTGGRRGESGPDGGESVKREEEKKKKTIVEEDKRIRDEKERLEREKAEQEEREKLEKEINEEKHREKRELEEKLEREEHQARLRREEKEREERERLEKEKETKEKPVKEEQQENKSKVSTRGRKAARKTTAAAAACSTEQDSAVLVEDDVPARRTRSRSNSISSISSDRSASSINTQQGSGRGRGREAKRTSEPPKTVVVRSSNRRRTVAAETTEQDNNHGGLSRSNNSLNTSDSVSSQSRGRGGRQRGRSRITEAEPDSIPPVITQRDQSSALKPAARGQKGRKTEPSSNAVPQEDAEEKAGSQQARTTRGQRRATTNISESTAADEEKQSNQDEGHGSEESRLPKRKVWGRASSSNGDEAKDKRQQRKRELEPNVEEDSHSSTDISEVTTQQGGNDETKEEHPVQAKRRGRASGVKEQEECGTSASSTTQEAKVHTPEPRTPTSRATRKRQAPAVSSPVAKTPRSSPLSSPAARGRPQAPSQAYKVLFTGLTDEAGERVLARLGGRMAKGVADMNCLVTDQVRRTIKFLCAVAKGIPIVTTCWLEKSGKAGSFLSPQAFVVKDLELEKKFGFCLQTSLTVASSQPLLRGYEIHVTKSVMPEPGQMKDIIFCSGATFLTKMPSSHKPQTVVISCEEDWSLCGPAVSSSLPVVTAEFILSGVLQQKVDFQTHALSAPATNAGGRGRGRRKT